MYTRMHILLFSKYIPNDSYVALLILTNKGINYRTLMQTQFWHQQVQCTTQTKMSNSITRICRGGGF